MNFALLILIINLLFFVSVAFYYSTLKKQLREEAKLDLEERKQRGAQIQNSENQLKAELEDVKKRANMILMESEKIANDLVVELEKTLGKQSTTEGVAVHDSNNFESELGNLSAKLKEQYVNRIHSMLRSLERFQMQEAHKVEVFAQEQAETTDENLQKLRVQELNKIHERVERYKQEEIALFDSKVKGVIDGAAKEVLGHALTNQELGELITKALEKSRLEKKL